MDAMPTILRIVVIWCVGSTAVGWLCADLSGIGHGSVLVLVCAWFVGVIGLLIHLLVFLRSRRSAGHHA